MTDADKPDRYGLSISLICLATLCFAVMGGCVKLLSSELPSGQIIWGRYFFHALLIFMLFPAKAPRIMVSKRIDLQIIRSVLVLGATICAFVALRYLPMADVAAIGFVSPLVVVSLAGLVLGEKISPTRWFAVIIGFVGVLVILRPGSGSMHWAALLQLFGVCCYGSYQILTRKIRGLAPPMTSLFYSALVGTVVSSLWLPLIWQSPEPKQWLMMAGTGLLGGSGHLALIKALESAPASVAGPFVYSELLWAIGIGFLLFGALPDIWTLIGAGVLVATGVYLLRTDQPKPTNEQATDAR